MTTRRLSLLALGLLTACGGGADRADMPDVNADLEIAEPTDPDALPGLAMLDDDEPLDPNLLTTLPEACTLLTGADVSELLGADATAQQVSHSGKASSECSYYTDGSVGMALNIMFVLDDFVDAHDPASLQALIEGLGGTVTGPVDVPGDLHSLRGEMEGVSNVWVANGMRGTSMMTDRPISHLIVHVGIDSGAPADDRLAVLVDAAAIVLERVRRDE